MAMSVTGTASMLRARRRDVNVKPNRRLDRKSSRGMLYENEELRLRTININAEVERGQNDIKKLRRENELLRREIWGLREEYDRLESLLGILHDTANFSDGYPDLFKRQNSDEERFENKAKIVQNKNSQQNMIHVEVQSCGSCSTVEFSNTGLADADSSHNIIASEENNYQGHHKTRIKNNLDCIFPEDERVFTVNEVPESHMRVTSMCGKNYASSYEIPSTLEIPRNRTSSQPLFSTGESNVHCATHTEASDILSKSSFPKSRRDILKKSQSEFSLQLVRDEHIHDIVPLKNIQSKSLNHALQSSCWNRKETTQMPTKWEVSPFSSSQNNLNPYEGESSNFFAKKSNFPEGGNLEDLLSDMQKNPGQLIGPDSSVQRFHNSDFGSWDSRPNENSVCQGQNNELSIAQEIEDENNSAHDKKKETETGENGVVHLIYNGMTTTFLDNSAFTFPDKDNLPVAVSNASPESNKDTLEQNLANTMNLCDLRSKKWLSQSEQILNIDGRKKFVSRSASFSSFGRMKMKGILSRYDGPRLTETNILKTVNGSDEGANVSWKCHRRRSIMNDVRNSFLAGKTKLEINAIGHPSLSSVEHHFMNEENILKQEIGNEVTDFKFNTKCKVENKNVKYEPSDGLYHCIQSYTRRNHNSSGFGSHFQSLHKMSVIVGDTERGRSLIVDHSLSSCWKDPHINGHYVKHTTVCSNNQRKIGICEREDKRNNDSGDPIFEKNDSFRPKITSPFPISHVSFKGFPSGRSISWERNNSFDSSSSSLDVHLNTRKKRVRRANSVEQNAKEPVPWCGCWGNGCI